MSPNRRAPFAAPLAIAALLAAGIACPPAVSAASPHLGATPIRGTATRNQTDLAPYGSGAPGNVGRAGAMTPQLPALGWNGPRSTTPAPTTRSAVVGSVAGANVTATVGEVTAAAPAAAGGPGVIAANAFYGLNDTGNNSSQPDCAGLAERPCGEPPDPWVAVGTDHVLQVVNWRVRVTDRIGGAPVGASTGGWFGIQPISAGRLPANTDARVIFDQARGRWLASDLAYDCTGSVITIMVSKDTGGSPLPFASTGWTRYTIHFDGVIADSPSLGSSDGLVAIGVNRYPVTCNPTDDGSLPVQPVLGAFAGSSLLVLDWSALLAGPATIPYLDVAPVLDPGPSPAVFSFAPARQAAGSVRLHVVVAAKTNATDPEPLAVGYTALSGGVGDASNPASLTVVPLQLVAGVALADPPAPVDVSGSTLPAAADFRITDAVWRSGRLAFTSTVSSGGDGARPRGRIVELATAAASTAPAATLTQLLTIEPTTGTTDTFVPGVGYANDGTLWAVYSQSGPIAAISSWARRQLTADRAATPDAAAFSGGAALVASGRDAYAGLNRRWGDSVGVASDPLAANSGSVWQANEFADTLEGWATYVARLGNDATAPAAPGSLTPSFRTGAAVGKAAVPITLSWPAVADTGSGVARYELRARIGAADWSAVPLASVLSQSATLSLAYRTAAQFQVRAVDNAGNVGTWRTGVAFTPTLLAPITASGASFSGKWSWGSCSTCVAGRVRGARRAGARINLVTTALGIAWVTLLGPARGSARVRIDGRVIGTYSTHASRTVVRRLIAARTFTAKGRHTFRIDVLGTHGHPRVDVDVFIVLR